MEQQAALEFGAASSCAVIRQQEVSLVFEGICHHALKCTSICWSKIVLMWAALQQCLHMTNGMEQWLIVFTSLRGLPLSSKLNIKKLRDDVFLSHFPAHVPKGGSSDPAERQGYCFGHVCFCMVTEFNPLEPIKHMAKQLFPIYVLQQLPLALPSTAPAGGEATEKSHYTHTFLFLWTASGFAGWLGVFVAGY